MFASDNPMQVYKKYKSLYDKISLTGKIAEYEMKSSSLGTRSSRVIEVLKQMPPAPVLEEVKRKVRSYGNSEK